MTAQEAKELRRERDRQFVRLYNIVVETVQVSDLLGGVPDNSSHMRLLRQAVEDCQRFFAREGEAVLESFKVSAK